MRSPVAFAVLLVVVVATGVLLQNQSIVDVVHSHRSTFFLALAALALYGAIRGRMTGGYRTGEFGFGRVVSKQTSPVSFQITFALGLLIAAIFFWMYFHPGLLP